MPDSSESAPTPNRRLGDSSRILVAVSAVALVLALVAVGLAIWALVRSSSGDGPASAYTDAQHAAAKANVCKAYDVVRRGVTRNTTLQAPGGDADVTGTLAVAANSRVSLYDGGQYLLARLDPATPPDLADPVRKFANSLIDIGANATAGVPNTDPDQAARLREAEGVNSTIDNLCK